MGIKDNNPKSTSAIEDLFERVHLLAIEVQEVYCDSSPYNTTVGTGKDSGKQPEQLKGKTNNSIHNTVSDIRVGPETTQDWNLLEVVQQQ